LCKVRLSGLVQKRDMDFLSGMTEGMFLSISQPSRVMGSKHSMKEKG